jgi:hypothetical protein
MAGGVANIWGHLLNSPGDGASGPYPHPAWIKTNAEFFRTRFSADLSRCEDLAEGLCLERPSGQAYLFYEEDAGSLWMDLSGMQGPQSAVAVDAKKPYQEIDLGVLQPEAMRWNAPYESDWALAVGDFGEPPQSSFEDVPTWHPYYAEIEALYQAGYVAGCSEEPRRYCPEQAMNRAESAVFVERGIWGAAYTPPEPAERVFADVPLGLWYTKWANHLWEDEYTAGCGEDPLVYCPERGHTRAEGAVFFLRMLHGTTYEPPPAEGLFTDVPIDAWYAKWAEAAHAAGLIEPCDTEPQAYCPLDPLTRAVGAYMMSRAKGLENP